MRAIRVVRPQRLPLQWVHIGHLSYQMLKKKKHRIGLPPFTYDEVSTIVLDFIVLHRCYTVPEYCRSSALQNQPGPLYLEIPRGSLGKMGSMLTSSVLYFTLIFPRVWNYFTWTYISSYVVIFFEQTQSAQTKKSTRRRPHFIFMYTFTLYTYSFWLLFSTLCHCA